MSLPQRRSEGRPRLVILLPMVWSVRNVVYSGVLRRLAAQGIDVHLLLAQCPPGGGPLPTGFEDAASVDAMLQPARRQAHGLSFLNNVEYVAFNRRANNGSYSLFRRWLARALSGRDRLRQTAIDIVAAGCQTRWLFHCVNIAVDRAYRRSYDLAAVGSHLRGLAPDVVWSTGCIYHREYPYVRVARDLGIPLIASILSFDNLTSRGRLPEFDRYLLWNARMRDDLLRLYPQIPEHRTVVTGTPQFDFHVDPRFRWTRQRTLAELALDASARYVVYAAGHESLLPDEPRLVLEVVKRARHESALSDLSWVIRLHPLEDPARWAVVAAEPSVVISHPWEVPADASGWTLSCAEDQARLVSTLAHAEVCVNVGSTMTLDAAMLDRPVVGIDFSADPEWREGLFFDAYQTEHYKPLVESGGLSIAHDWSALFQTLRSARCRAEQGRAARRAMVQQACGVVDGRAAARVASAIVEFTIRHNQGV